MGMSPEVLGSEGVAVVVGRRGAGELRRGRVQQLVHRGVEAHLREPLDVAGARAEARAPQQPLGLRLAEHALNVRIAAAIRIRIGQQRSARPHRVRRQPMLAVPPPALPAVLLQHVARASASVSLHAPDSLGISVGRSPPALEPGRFPADKDRWPLAPAWVADSEGVGELRRPLGLDRWLYAPPIPPKSRWVAAAPRLPTPLPSMPNHTQRTAHARTRAPMQLGQSREALRVPAANDADLALEAEDRDGARVEAQAAAERGRLLDPARRKGAEDVAWATNAT